MCNDMTQSNNQPLVWLYNISGNTFGTVVFGKFFFFLCSIWIKKPSSEVKQGIDTNHTHNFYSIFKVYIFVAFIVSFAPHFFILLAIFAVFDNKGRSVTERWRLSLLNPKLFLRDSQFWVLNLMNFLSFWSLFTSLFFIFCVFSVYLAGWWVCLLTHFWVLQRNISSRNFSYFNSSIWLVLQ